MARFSLVVPTTDRPSLLPGVVETVLASSFTDIELIVSDNCSKIPATELLAGNHDPRIKHLRTASRLSCSDHWDFIWEHVTGEYVMYLGDDNVLHPDILSRADKILSRHDLGALCWRVGAYFHPDWQVKYPPLPDHGNVFGIEVGTTRRLYRGHPKIILRHFADSLAFPGCFPCMQNFVFRKELGDIVRRRSGRLFWAPGPDVAASIFMLAVMPKAGYAFLDDYGALAGRSGDSNQASLLGGGKRGGSQRFREYVKDYSDGTLFPHHEPKFCSIANLIAAPFSQGYKFFPEEFADLRVSDRAIARGTIEGIYVQRNLPWCEDPTFLAEVEQYFDSLPPALRAEIHEYRAQCIAGVKQKRSVQSQLHRLRAGLGKIRRGDWSAFRNTAHDVSWQAGGQTYVNMSSFGVSNMAGMGREFAAVLRRFDRLGSNYVDYHSSRGVLGEELTVS